MITLEELLSKKTYREQELEQLKSELEKCIDEALLNKRAQGENSFTADVDFQLRQNKTDKDTYEAEVVNPVLDKYEQKGWDIFIRVKRFPIDTFLCSVKGTIKRKN